MSYGSELNTFQRHPRLYELIVGDLIRGLPRGGIFIDGGAHVGEHTATMLQRGDATKVYAIEAIPELARGIADRYATDQRLTVVNAAIGMSCGTVSFKVAQGAMGYSGLRERKIAAVSTWTSVDVPLTTLDATLPGAEHEQVALIKLDVEGNEFDVMRGTSAVLHAARPLVVFENALREPAAEFGYTWYEVADFMAYTGYEFIDFFGKRVDKTYWDAPLGTYMFLAVPRNGDTRSWLQARLPAMTAARCAQV